MLRPYTGYTIAKDIAEGPFGVRHNSQYADIFSNRFISQHLSPLYWKRSTPLTQPKMRPSQRILWWPGRRQMLSSSSQMLYLVHDLLVLYVICHAAIRHDAHIAWIYQFGFTKGMNHENTLENYCFGDHDRLLHRGKRFSRSPFFR